MTLWKYGYMIEECLKRVIQYALTLDTNMFTNIDVSCNHINMSAFDFMFVSIVKCMKFFGF